MINQKEPAFNCLNHIGLNMDLILKEGYVFSCFSFHQLGVVCIIIQGISLNLTCCLKIQGVVLSSRYMNKSLLAKSMSRNHFFRLCVISEKIIQGYKLEVFIHFGKQVTNAKSMTRRY